MSTAVWPPIDPLQLVDEQAQSQARELEWLLRQLRDTLQSLKAGLEETAALLAPSENGSTLVLSSVRSECLKGLVTRVGTRIVKGVRCAACTHTKLHVNSGSRMSSSACLVSHPREDRPLTISPYPLRPRPLRS